MNVLVSGYYGLGNIGDEAVLQAIVKGLTNAKITVLSANPELTIRQHNIRAVNRNNPFSLLFELLRTNIFISGGGTLFQNITSSRSLIYYLCQIILAKLLFKKVIVFAQGFGPVKGREWQRLISLILNKVNLITLRDKDSFEELQKLGINKPKIEVTADPTFTLPLPDKAIGRKILKIEGVPEGKKLVGIVVRNLKGKPFDQQLAEIINWLKQTYDYLPVFLLFKSPADMEPTVHVVKHLITDSKVVFRESTPDEMLAIIANLDLLIGMRLHSLIFAAMNSIPMLGLSYDPKVESFMKEIDQPYIKLDEDFDIEHVKTLVKTALGKKSTNLTSLQQRAKRNFEVINA
ncbi:MAG: polysaccharide pyruvyl transferase CsaB [Candidatus Margulisbacteria bacterium]|nr:polysaccharide pyruvyl transferase CsaB [Candidatus Margulisiibacteriota bacterium]